MAEDGSRPPTVAEVMELLQEVSSGMQALTNERLKPYVENRVEAANTWHGIATKQLGKKPFIDYADADVNLTRFGPEIVSLFEKNLTLLQSAIQFLPDATKE